MIRTITCLCLVSLACATSARAEHVGGEGAWGERRPLANTTNPAIGERHVGAENVELTASLSYLDLTSEQVTSDAKGRASRPRLEIELEGRAWITSWLAANLTAAFPDNFGSARAGGEATLGGSVAIEGPGAFASIAFDRVIDSAISSSGFGAGETAVSAAIGLRTEGLEVATEFGSGELLVTASLEF